jgi:UV DNA damage endonuclease
MPSSEKPIQLGLCCLNTVLRAENPPVYCSRTIIQRIIKERGIEELKSRALQNCRDIINLIEWNEKNGIRVFRLSSELFPHKSNENVEDYTLDYADSELKKVGALARKYGHRLTFHPGQYNVLGTPNPKTLQRTIADLDWHAEVLDRMEMPPESVMVIHGGGLYGDKKATMDRWCENYMKLPSFIKKRLVLENCEKCFSVTDCLLISQRVGVPVVFDTHHFECYKLLHPNETFEEMSFYIPDILNSWGTIKPKFHISEQGSGKIGHHSDFIENIPQCMLDIPKDYNVNIDIMIEAKKKELAIFKLYAKYPQLNCLD